MGFENKTKKVIFTFGVLAILSYTIISFFPVSFNRRGVSQNFHSYFNWSEIHNAIDVRDIRHGKVSLKKVVNPGKGEKMVSVAVGLAITSKGMANNSAIEKMEIFRTFLPSFCRTASVGFSYVFYMAYDNSDDLFGFSKKRASFRRTFNEVASRSCENRVVVTNLRLVECQYTGKPTWSQNDALKDAYLDDVEYYYRVNDDTEFTTENWTEKFIEVLNRYVPPNVGVVGPTHRKGNTAILTYDFVHRTHLDLFGFYYPRMYLDWSGDHWMTNVYAPKRSRKLEDVFLTHTMNLNRRYDFHPITEKQKHIRLSFDKKIVERYVDYKRLRKYVSKVPEKGRNKVISISLLHNKPECVWGAIRNAQLSPILFPDWTLRLYVPLREAGGIANPSVQVPPRVISTLLRLGAEVVYVQHKRGENSFEEYTNLAVIDDSQVDYFLIRSCERRLSERDAISIADWIKESERENKNAAELHCFRDHPKHVTQPLVEGLWGGRRKLFKENLNCSISDIFTFFAGENAVHGCDSVKAQTIKLSFRGNVTFTSKSVRESNHTNGDHSKLHPHHDSHKEKINLLHDVIWPLMSVNAYCHDSVSCRDWPGTHPFPDTRHNWEYLGREYDEHQEPVEEVNVKNYTNPVCVR